MLVLLVIVLTTATFVAKGIIPVDLPNASSAVKQEEKKSLTITIEKSGQILFDKQEVAKEDIEKVLLGYEKNTAVAINCDKKAEFETFVYLLDILENNQFKNLGIITKKTKREEAF